MCHAVEDRGEVRSQRASVGLSTRARTAAARCRARIRARWPRIAKTNHLSRCRLCFPHSASPPAFAGRRQNSSSAFFFSPPTLPLNQISDETKRRGSFIKVNRAGEGAGIIYLYTTIKVNKARENAGIIYIHQSHRSRRGRHVYMISKSTRSSTRPAGGATMRSFELGGMPACSSTDSCRSTDNFRSTDTRSSASSSVPVGLCALFPAHRGQP